MKQPDMFDSIMHLLALGGLIRQRASGLAAKAAQAAQEADRDGLHPRAHDGFRRAASELAEELGTILGNYATTFDVLMGPGDTGEVRVILHREGVTDPPVLVVDNDSGILLFRESEVNREPQYN